MKQKLLGVGIAVLALSLMFGCGGGGGGGTTTTATTGTVTVTISPSKITLKPGATTTFSASVSDGSGVTFSKTGGGTLVQSGLSANYTAPALTGNYSVTATSVEQKSVSQSSAVTVSTGSVGNTVNLSGSVSDPSPLNNVIVEFFSSTGALIGTATTVNGAFNTVLPTTAFSFNLKASTINTTNDYSEFYYNGAWYDPLISGCNAPLPTLTGGEVLTLSAIQLDQTSNPPPPPPGCG